MKSMNILLIVWGLIVLSMMVNADKNFDFEDGLDGFVHDSAYTNGLNYCSFAQDCTFSHNGLCSLRITGNGTYSAAQCRLGLFSTDTTNENYKDASVYIYLDGNTQNQTTYGVFSFSNSLTVAIVNKTNNATFDLQYAPRNTWIFINGTGYNNNTINNVSFIIGWLWAYSGSGVNNVYIDEITLYNNTDKTTNTTLTPLITVYSPLNGSTNMSLGVPINFSVSNGTASTYDTQVFGRLAGNLWNYSCNYSALSGTNNLSCTAMTNLSFNQTYEFYLTANDSNGNTTTGIYSFTIQNQLIVDLSIPPDNITFSPMIPKKGETVDLSGVIYSDSNTAVDNVKVRFYKGDSGTGEQIGEVNIAEIPAQGHEVATTQWTPTQAGPYNITVVVDPNNTITETNEDNNQATKEITIATYRVLVVGTYYLENETLEDIVIYNTSIIQKLDETTQFYKEQSYGHDYVLFTNPIYLNMDHPSGYYLDSVSDGNQYSPPRSYASEIIGKLGSSVSNYDAIISYQTDINGIFRGVAYKDLNFACLGVDSTQPDFAHEIGHALYKLDDFYIEHGVATRGNLPYDLMGSSSSGFPLTSFNRVNAGWLNYSLTHTSDLIEPKTFKITQLSEMYYGDNVEKIEGVEDSGIDLSYDFILEANKYGVTIYEDHHGFLGSFLKNLEPQSKSGFLSTLNVESLTYNHPWSGMEFECINGAQCINTSVDSKPEILSHYNVGSYGGMLGVKLDNFNLFEGENITPSKTSTATSKHLSGGVGFPSVLPVSAELNESGHLVLTFENPKGTSIFINSINLFETPKQICAINTQLPIRVMPKGRFIIENDGCASPERYKHISLGIIINYSEALQGGNISNTTYISDGRIILDPVVPDEAPWWIQIIPSLLLFEFVFILLLVIYRKNKRIKIIMGCLIISFLVLLGLIWLIDTGRFADVTPAGRLVYPPLSPVPLNITYPDLDLHAYTPDDLHVGMNYSSGVYENQIPGAIASGDLVGEQWIFVPNGTNVSFVVDSHDVSEYLNETNSSENLSLNYSLQFMQYGPNPNVSVVNDTVVINDRVVYEPMNETIGAGEQETFSPPTALCASGGVRVCGIDYCCGAADGVCPRDFNGVSCSSDPDCSACEFGGVSVCGVNYCCGAADGVCPSNFGNISCSIYDVNC